MLRSFTGTMVALAGDEYLVRGAVELQAFTGRFYSEEIETFYTIILDEDHLVLNQRRMDDADLTPGEEDEFAGGGAFHSNLAWISPRSPEIINTSGRAPWSA